MIYRLVFSGLVQGVGFRFTARSCAHGLGIKGYVRNMPDGAVELVCACSENECGKLIADIKSSLGRYIEDVRIEEVECEENFEGFNIKF